MSWESRHVQLQLHGCDPVGSNEGDHFVPGLQWASQLCPRVQLQNSDVAAIISDDDDCREDLYDIAFHLALLRHIRPAERSRSDYHDNRYQ